MKSITITLLTLPNGKLSVRTDGPLPSVGKPVTASEALHMELMALCARQVQNIMYGNAVVPLVALAREMVSPEGYGHCLPRDAHAYVNRILNGEAS